MRYYYFVSYCYKREKISGFRYGNINFDCNFKIKTNNEINILTERIVADLTKVGLSKKESFYPIILNIVLLDKECDGEK